MPDPIETPLMLNGTLDHHIKSQNTYVVFTHAVRTRQLIAVLFSSYLAIFVLFIRSLIRHFREIRELPPMLAQLEAASGNQWLSQILAALGVVVAIGFFLYFLWAFLDIWGLQVCLSPICLNIQNTLTGAALPRLMGVGIVDMADIKELHGSRMFTHIKGGGRLLRFSPVENVDQLIAAILTYAPQAVVIEKKDSQ